MKKRNYSNPWVEIVMITAGQHLLDTSIEVLPPHPAPKLPDGGSLI